MTAIATTTPPRGQYPALPAPEADAFPEALTGTPQWVGYAWEMRDGTRTKVPKDPHTGRNGSTTAPATWADFATARAFALRHGYGLGFMLTPPFVGIDLDHCRDAATGELSTLGVSVLGELDTYAEVSVSGTGVKAIAYGEKPGTRCRRSGLELEIYSEKRLFALTGQRLDDAPLQINDCQDALTHIYTAAFGQTEPPPTAPTPTFVTTDDDRAVLAWLTIYRPKFTPLWTGDTDAYNGDHSAADQALCNMLAFRTGDENRVDSLFRQSGLYRPKWERGDYRHATIAKAMRQRRFFTPSTPTPSTLERPPQSNDPPPPWADAPPAPDLDLLRRENARLRAELAAEREHRAAVHALVTNKDQTPVERLIAYGLIFEVQSAASRGVAAPEDPEARPVNCTAIGKRIGLTTQTVSANIARFDQRGQVRKVVSMKTTRDGKPYPEIAVYLPGETVAEKLRTAATWQRPEGTKGVGGNGKRCPNCAGTETKKSVETKTVETTTLSCADCGHVHAQTRRTIGTPTTTYSYSTAIDAPAMLDPEVLAARRATPSTLEGVASPEALPPPDTNTSVDGPRVISRTPQADEQPPPPVAAWAGTHPCRDCGETCYAPAGTVPRCIPCQRARDAGGDVAAAGG